MKVQVTKLHIETGQLCDSGRCPVALALRDAGRGHVDVTQDWIWTDMGRVRCPDDVSMFVRHFDEDGPEGVRAFEFELPVPSVMTQDALPL